jgi:hypothetical protein
MIVNYAALPARDGTKVFEQQGWLANEELYVGFPWKNMSATSRFVAVFNPGRVENVLVNHSFQKLSAQGLDFWIEDEVVSDQEILKAASKDDAYALLLSPEEDLYSLQDGIPFDDKK